MAANIGWSVGFHRTNPYPLDSASVFDTLADLEAYLATPVAYAGQIVTVVGDNNETTAYVINEDMTYSEVKGGGGTPIPPATDGFLATHSGVEGEFGTPVDPATLGGKIPAGTNGHLATHSGTEGQFGTPVDPATVVRTTGNQTIAGTKTFSAQIIGNNGLDINAGTVSFSNLRVRDVGTPSANADAANKQYVDNTIVGGSNFFSLIPDYANMETTNRIPLPTGQAQTGSWTVDRDGFVLIAVFADDPTAGYITINNVRINQIMPDRTTSEYTKNETVYGERTGDVITICSDNVSTFAGQRAPGCYFIPPRIAWAIAPATKHNMRLIGQPDFSKSQLVKSTSTAQSLTASNDGYFALSIANGSGTTLSVSMNGNVILSDLGGYSGRYSRIDSIIPVTKGDINPKEKSCIIIEAMV